MSDTDARRGSGPAAIPYVPAVIPPDAARDARVAARRATDAARAGVALDRLLTDRCEGLGCSCCNQIDDLRYAVRDGLVTLQHNRHYGPAHATSPEACGPTPGGGWHCRPWDCGRPRDCPLPPHEDAWVDAWVDTSDGPR